MEITPTTLKEFRTDFANAVSELENKYGFKLSLGNIQYSSNEFHTKMVSVLSDPTTVGKTTIEIQAEKEWLNGDLTLLYGFKRTHLGTTFIHKNKRYKIVGIQRNSRKYPILTKNLLDNKLVSFTVESVKQYYI